MTAGMMVFLERCDQGAQSRRKDDQVTGVRLRSVSVSNASWDEYRAPYTDRLGSVGATKCKLAFQDMPRFVIGIMNVQCRRTAAAPLINLKRFA